MWDRLPREMRRLRSINLFALAVLLPLQLAGMIWMFSGTGIETFALLRADQRPLVNLILAGIVGIGVAMVASIGVLASRLRRRQTHDP